MQLNDTQQHNARKPYQGIAQVSPSILILDRVHWCMMFVWNPNSGKCVRGGEVVKKLRTWLTIGVMISYWSFWSGSCPNVTAFCATFPGMTSQEIVYDQSLINSIFAS
jgi:hypothetical protein